LLFDQDQIRIGNFQIVTGLKRVNDPSLMIFVLYDTFGHAFKDAKDTDAIFSQDYEIVGRKHKTSYVRLPQVKYFNVKSQTFGFQFIYLNMEDVTFHSFLASHEIFLSWFFFIFNYSYTGITNIRTKFLLYEILRLDTFWMLLIKFYKVKPLSLITTIGQYIEFAFEIIHKLYMSNVKFVININLLFIAKIQPDNIVIRCNHHYLLILIKNEEFWLTVYERKKFWDDRRLG
jgi:hypothetical protein